MSIAWVWLQRRQLEEEESKKEMVSVHASHDLSQEDVSADVAASLVATWSDEQTYVPEHWLLGFPESSGSIASAGHLGVDRMGVEFLSRHDVSCR